MDVQSEALWGLTGMESGNINLVTIRHEEGKCHHVLRNHTAPVSVLQITPQETGVISGSWDKSVLVSESCYFMYISKVNLLGFKGMGPKHGIRRS